MAYLAPCNPPGCYLMRRCTRTAASIPLPHNTSCSLGLVCYSHWGPSVSQSSIKKDVLTAAADLSGSGGLVTSGRTKDTLIWFVLYLEIPFYLLSFGLCTSWHDVRLWLVSVPRLIFVLQCLPPTKQTNQKQQNKNQPPLPSQLFPTKCITEIEPYSQRVKSSHTPSLTSPRQNKIEGRGEKPRLHIPSLKKKKFS